MEHHSIIKIAENKLLLYAKQTKITEEQDRDAQNLIKKAREAIQESKAKNPAGPWKIWAQTLKKAFDIYYQAREKHHKEMREDALRRAQIVLGPKFDSVAAESDPEEYLATAIKSQYTGEDILAETNERHREVVYLVRSINELAAMFNDLAILVQEQSEILNNIESNIEHAVVNVKKGNNNLRQAIDSQKRSRKLYCCGCVCLLLVIATIAGVAIPFSIKSI